VLQPLLEIAPECVIPGIGKADEAARICDGQQLQRLVQSRMDTEVHG